MPKLQTVTNVEIAALISRAYDFIGDVQTMANSIEKGYVEVIDKPTDYSRTLALLARSALELQMNVMTKQALDEHRREIERMTRERDALKSAIR